MGDAGVRGREQEITGRFKEPGPKISASGIGRKGCGDLCNTWFIKGHKPSNHIHARIKSHVYITE